MKTPNRPKRPDITVYEYLDYRLFLRGWIEKVADKQRGQLSRIAEAGRVHKTTLSQVFSGAKDLTPEQGCAIAKHLGLSTSAAEYFLLLIGLARAGSSELRAMLRQQIEDRRKVRKELSSRVTRSRDMRDGESAVFYSNWLFSAIRNITAIEGYGRPAEIARALGLSLAELTPMIDFLLAHGLCVDGPRGLRPGPKMTHLDASSPFVSRHHANWRIRAMGVHPVLRAKDELAYTAPMTLSAADVSKVRALIADLVEETDQIVGPSVSEKLYCMCLDWFEVR